MCLASSAVVTHKMGVSWMSQKKPDSCWLSSFSAKVWNLSKVGHSSQIPRWKVTLKKDKKKNEQNGRHLSKNRPDALLLHGIQHIYTNLGRNNEVDSLHLRPQTTTPQTTTTSAFVNIGIVGSESMSTSTPRSSLLGHILQARIAHARFVVGTYLHHPSTSLTRRLF